MRAVIQTFFGVILSAVLLVTVPITAYAEPTIDAAKSGMITVSMLSPDRKEPVAGVSFEVFYVGTLGSASSNISFVLTDTFTGSDVIFTDLSASRSKLAAKALADFAKANAISPIAQEVTGANGKVQFSELKLGLYLLVGDFGQNSSYTKPDPLLVGIPFVNEQGTDWVYAANVFPKIEKKPVPTTKTLGEEDEPTQTVPTTKTLGVEDELPQTGLLRWPIPVLSAGGILLFSLGWASIYLKRKNKHE